MAASPSASGGSRSLVTLRMLLGNLDMIVLLGQKTIPNAFVAFAEDGSPKNAGNQQAVTEPGGILMHTADKLCQ